MNMTPVKHSQGVPTASEREQTCLALLPKRVEEQNVERAMRLPRTTECGDQSYETGHTKVISDRNHFRFTGPSPFVITNTRLSSMMSCHAALECLAKANGS